ncbi:Uncharacterised protein [Legionella moravica]|uniref:Uncharacterized protein n=1 Tax=Legionella moravica TaxID=39962 RepID=A0A378K0N9_9GAMM|nr:Uncharacterised protein [Legionella moravica]
MTLMMLYITIWHPCELVVCMGIYKGLNFKSASCLKFKDFNPLVA